jgi:pectate lyase
VLAAAGIVSEAECILLVRAALKLVSSAMTTSEVLALLVSVAALAGCDSTPMNLLDDGGDKPPDAAITSGDAPSSPGGPVGFAAMPAFGLATTTGGAGGPTATVTTAAELEAQVNNDDPRVVQISGEIEGVFHVGSNKTIVGLAGAVLRGSVQFTGANNVIMQNLKVVGFNCTDTSSCGNGLDAIVVRNGHHFWFDHLDISDGSDGNLDFRGADYVTVSWTKFHYSPARAPNTGDPHRFANLVTTDTPSVRFHVSFHHCWWADRVHSRMPRVSFGDVHIFNSLYTSAGSEKCVQAHERSNVLTEHNHFLNIEDPVDVEHATAITSSVGNIYENVDNPVEEQGAAFTPPYPYTLDPAASVRAAVEASAGPQ